MAFQYSTIVEETNFVPVAIEVRRDGELLPSLGVSVTVTVKDRDQRDPVTKQRVVIVDGAAATPHPQIVGRWEYWFEPEHFVGITNTRVWLVEWKLSVGPYTWRTPEPATLVVKKKL